MYVCCYATVYIFGTNKFIGNSALDGGGGILAKQLAVVHIVGTSNFMNNSAEPIGGGVLAQSATVYISRSNNFINNSAQRYGGGRLHAVDYVTQGYTGTGGGVSLYQSAVVHISGNISFVRNFASVRGGGMYVDTSSRAYFYGNSLFSENWSQHGGGISMQRSEIMLQGNTVFSNNTASYGGAIQATEANINAAGNVRYKENLATVNGGALSLARGSVAYIFETSSFMFVENRADSFGGAIYIEDNTVHCSYDWNNKAFLHSSLERSYECRDLLNCFDYIASKLKINISFSGNSAMAGSAIFGGALDEVTLNDVQVAIIDMDYKLLHFYQPTVAELLFHIFSTDIDGTNNGSTISSNPNRICRCINGQPDCSDPPTPQEVSVYPGQTVGVSLVAVGQRNGTVPSATTAQYDPDNGATFRDLQSAQRLDHTTCTQLSYTIFSRKESETLKIYVDSSCGLKGIPLSVNVTLLVCPIGFTLSNSSNQCICEERLQNYTSNCNISNLQITRAAPDDFWVGVVNTNGTEGLILHPHCPFDYCTTDTVHFTLVTSGLVEDNDIPLTDTQNATLNYTDDSNTSVTVLNNTDTQNNATVNNTDATDYAIGNSIDAQCNYNRSGLLCGKCQKGFSLVLGSSKCLKCSNSYLSLLISFALAGFVLVVFIFILKLTVAVGTVSGLIFYANIVSVNKAQLFPSEETNILIVFIAWVNLDLGIETCFFDGMDAYSKAWLQYAFPIYVWVLVVAIILASHYSTRIARCLGTNPVAVLATLFLDPLVLH